MEVDTGAALSIISGENKMRHFPDLPLQSSTLLQTYTGESMKVLGEIQVKVQHDRQERDLVLVWLEKLTKIGVIAVERLAMDIEQLCNRYSEVYQDELGLTRVRWSPRKTRDRNFDRCRTAFEKGLARSWTRLKLYGSTGKSCTQ